MKEGWEYKKLGDFCRKGKNIKWDDQTNDTSFRYIDLTSVDRNDLCIHNPQIITKDNAPSRAKQIIQAGDIIFATTRPTLRRVSLIDEQYDGDICSTGFCVLRPNKEVKSKIIFYALLNDSFYKYIESLQTGANYPAVTDSIVKNYIILVPPLSEQQSIVDYLDSAFAKIDAMKANAEKALNEAKALFQASLKEMLEPKEGWEEKELKDIVDTKCPISYGIVQQGDHVDGGIPVVRPVDLYRKYITSSNLKCTTQSISYSYKRTILRGDEILLGVRGTTGLVGIATEELKGSNVNRGIVPLFFKDGIYRDFIYYEMLSPAMQSVFAEKTTGATLKQINIKDLRTISFSYPVFEVQQSIVTTLDSLKSKVDRLQENYDKISQECDALKQAILRQVFE